jgi:4-hydroxy-tetrahydrodipicolinate synthase
MGTIPATKWVPVNRDDVSWRGYWPAAPTPFTRAGELDEDAARRLFALYRSQGVHGVLVNGTTGEWFSQAPAERRRVSEIAVQELKGHCPVLIGCTAYTPSEVIALAEHARDIGADGALATPPPYVHPSDKELVNFYETVTAGVNTPWMIYNWPRGTAVDMSAEVLSTLADLDNVVAIKESSGDELKTMVVGEQVVERVRFFARFIHRRGMAFLREVGGDGNIDGGALGAPFAVPFYEALWRGDVSQARQHGERYANLTGRLVGWGYEAKFASPTAQLKAAMNLLGQPGGCVRPPLLDLEDEATRHELELALRQGGLEPQPNAGTVPTQPLEENQ